MKNSQIVSIGITGTIGAGKSAVGKILEELGIPVIDTDAIVHDLLANDSDVQKLIVKRFGSQVAHSEDHLGIDRKALGQIVFRDPIAKEDLEKIIHPRVRVIRNNQIEEYAKQLDKNQPAKLVATLIPLLFETKQESEYDQIWTVITTEPVLRERLQKRAGFTDTEIDRRLASQWSQEKKAAMSDKVIDNSRDLAFTKKQVEDLLSELVHKCSR